MRSAALLAVAMVIGTGVACGREVDSSELGTPSNERAEAHSEREGSFGPDIGEPTFDAEEEDDADKVVQDFDDDVVAGPEETRHAFELADGDRPPLVLYLNGDGATVRRGWNDAALNTSTIVRTTTTFPPSRFRSDRNRWAKIVETVRGHFERYNVVVVDEEPTSGTYLEAIISGSSASLIGESDRVGGLAPNRCGIVSGAIVLVFDRFLRNEVHVAEVASHELGHSLSLSHTLHLDDLMSYTVRSPLAFADVLARCGTSSRNLVTCACGGTAQNNHLQLLRFVGGVSAASVNAAPRGSSGAAPIVSPTNGSRYVAGQTIEIRADGSKLSVGATASLHWMIDDKNYVFPCPSASCTVRNGSYTWRIPVGSGERNFYTRVTASNGRTFDSVTNRISSGSAVRALELSSADSTDDG